MRLGICTTTLEDDGEVYFCAGNLGSSAIDAFKDGRQCNKYCAMLELSPINTWDRHFKWYLYILSWTRDFTYKKNYFFQFLSLLFYVCGMCVRLEWQCRVVELGLFLRDGNWRLCLMGTIQYNIKSAPISLRPGKWCLTCTTVKANFQKMMQKLDIKWETFFQDYRDDSVWENFQ